VAAQMVAGPAIWRPNGRRKPHSVPALFDYGGIFVWIVRLGSNQIEPIELSAFELFFFPSTWCRQPSAGTPVTPEGGSNAKRSVKASLSDVTAMIETMGARP